MDPIPANENRAALPSASPKVEAQAAVPQGDFDLNSFLKGLAAQPKTAEALGSETPKPETTEKPERTALEIKAEILAQFSDVSPEMVARGVITAATAESDAGLSSQDTAPIEDLTHQYAYAYTNYDGRGNRASGDRGSELYNRYRDSGRQPALDRITASLRTLNGNQRIVDMTGQRLLTLGQVLSGNIDSVVPSELRQEVGLLDDDERAEITAQYVRETADDLAQIAIQGLTHPDMWGAGLTIAHLPQVADRLDVKQAVAALYVTFSKEPDNADENSRLNRALRTHDRLGKALSDKGIVIGRARVKTENAGEGKAIKIEEDDNPPVASPRQIIEETTTTLGNILKEKRGDIPGVKDAMTAEMKKQQTCDPLIVAYAAGNPPEKKPNEMWRI
jgi:hypothetical protein